VDPKVIAELIPGIAMLAVFGMPVAIVFVRSHFKYKNRELDAELEARRMLSERDKSELLARIERLENVLLGGARPAAQAAAPLPAVAAPAALPAALPDFPETVPSEEEQAAKRARER
jgi:hypothetical protein